MDFLFKVWSSNRENKTFIVLADENDLYVKLILKASERLKIDGSKLVLESDGTLIDDDQVLKMLNKETFILLSKDENWIPINQMSLNLSTCSTDTLVSSPLSSMRSSPSPPVRPESSSSRSSDDPTFHNVIGADTGIPSRVSQTTWEEFEIPWHQLNRSVIEDCEKGNRSQDCINKVVTVTVDSVREIKKYVSTKTYKVLAKKIINKYTKQFQDIDEDGVVIGDGCHSLTNKLIDRNNYLNRPHKRPTNSVHTEVPPSKRKTILRAKAGCSNWQPQVETLQPETLREKKNFLMDISVDENFTLNMDIIQHLNDTYTTQRLFLNSNPKIEEIQKEWPILLIKEVTFWHFEKLMDLKISELETMFIQRENKILQFGIERKFTQVTTIPNNENEKHKRCLQVIGDYFKENIQLFIKKVDENADVRPGIKSPSIIIKTIDPDSNNQSNKYCIFFEETELINLECANFMEALKVTVALYYNFNIDYPKGISNTLEFLQRYMLKINPDQGSKSNKKSIIKIVSFINKLKVFNYSGL